VADRYQPVFFYLRMLTASFVYIAVLMYVKGLWGETAVLQRRAVINGSAEIE
jgi:hypothetical protein